MRKTVTTRLITMYADKLTSVCQIFTTNIIIELSE